ncbi:unnamed protein product [Calicophoron daubneyi]|uniref:PWI domain-containing protein n=1 Tax=Calicophoron daubneyi TaxID=300641 RepID=A0AAV2T7M4_CALDB
MRSSATTFSISWKKGSGVLILKQTWSSDLVRRTECAAGTDFILCFHLLFFLIYPDPRDIQINITGFLNSKNARIFLTELWDLLLSAMETSNGIPTAFVEAKKAEITKRQEEEKRVQQELHRKENEIRRGNPVSRTNAMAGVPVQSSFRGQITQVVTAPMRRSNSTDGTKQPTESEDRNKVPGSQDLLDSSRTDKSASADHPKSRSASRSPRPSRSERPGSQGNPEKMDEHLNGSPGRHKHRHRRRRRSSSSSTESSSSDEGRRRGSRRHRHRSRSFDKPERIPQRRPVPDSDWRKDLMAGRRRSPPKMPENSFYGYEKHHRDPKHTRDHRRGSDYESDVEKRYRHRRESRHRHDETNPRHGSPHEVGDKPNADKYRRRREYELKTDFDIRDERNQRRRRERHRDSRSSDEGVEHLHERRVLDRPDRLERRPRRIEEEEMSRYHAEKALSSKRENGRDDAHIVAKRARSKSPEGPALPPIPANIRPIPTREKNPSAKRQTSSSASSESGSGSSESSSSSSEESSESDSGSVQTSSEHSDEENAESAASPKILPEGPALPPAAPPVEPEGPPLPPPSDAVPEWTDNPAAGEESSSSSSSSGSSSAESGSGDDSSSDSDSSSASGSTTEDEQSKRGKAMVKESRTDTDQRKVTPSPEGPALPPVTKPSQHRHHHSKGDQKVLGEVKDRPAASRDESAEEALRRRALASLIRASTDRKRTSSRSP